MNTKLNHVRDWPMLAKQANWSVTRLTKLCCVSRRTLHRHFLKHLGLAPKDWLAEQRQQLAKELLQDGASVKETAAKLGYEHAETFSRNFKKRYGPCPIKWQMSQNVTKCPF
jgi:transcriptional regulator GlxA family with amidase domain